MKMVPKLHYLLTKSKFKLVTENSCQYLTLISRL